MPGDAADALADQRLAQRPDQRDATRDRRLEQQVDARRVAATSNSSSPKFASSSLFAVTTGLPAFSAVEDERARRLDPADHLDDDVDVGIGDDALGVVGEHAGRERDVALLGEVLHRDARDLEAHARPARDQVGVRRRAGATSAAPTLPHPRMPTRTSPSSLRTMPPFSRIGRTGASLDRYAASSVEPHEVVEVLPAHDDPGPAVAHEHDRRAAGPCCSSTPSSARTRR